jgi:hypothetical protein
MTAPCGPAFVAYVDPGNFATNMAGGASYGDMLLWGQGNWSPPAPTWPSSRGHHHRGGLLRAAHAGPALRRLPIPASTRCGSSSSARSPSRPGSRSHSSPHHHDQIMTSRKDIMGALVNHRSTTIAAATITIAILALNGVLRAQA